MLCQGWFSELVIVCGHVREPISGRFTLKVLVVSTAYVSLEPQLDWGQEKTCGQAPNRVNDHLQWDSLPRGHLGLGYQELFETFLYALK